MKIVVLVKGVPDSEARITLKPDQSGLAIEDKNELNYFDELAVEEALSIKERVKEGSVTAISFGGKRAMEAVRKAVAMGADEAILVEGRDEEQPDGLMTAEVLAACIGPQGYQLILCGRKATDDDGSQVGPMVAELLGVPHVSAAVKVEVGDDQRSVTVWRDCDGGKEVLKCPLPGLLTAQKGLNEPRVPTIQGVMRGMKLQPRRIGLGELGLSQGEEPSGWKIVGFSEPPGRPPVRIVAGGDATEKTRELVRILREEIKIL